MRSSKYKSFMGIISLLLLIFVFLAIQNVFIKCTEENDHAKDYNGNLRISKPWDKIHIVGNQGWVDFKNDGNCTGSGNFTDPYIIEDLIIDAKDSGSCIIIEDSDVYFRIENCSLCYAGSGEYDSGIKLSNVTNGFLFKNHCYNNSQQGVLLTTCTNNTIIENLIEKNNYSQTGRGMIIRYSHFNSIFNNTISENFGSSFGYGMGLIYSDNNTFSGNKILKNKSPLGAGIGLEMYFCSNNTFTLNIIIDNSLAIRVSDASNNNRFFKNNLNGNAGFEIFECNYTLIFQNEIYAESYAFYLKIHTPVSTYSCQFNKIIKNNISTSNTFGITITDSYNNCIYHNNFQNSPEIRDNGANNSWDDGFAGNYWSHYSGVDNNPQDGIIDTPYSIVGSAGASDNKPLKYLTYEDYDGDGLTNYEEYTLGIDGYRTNVTDTDTDSDGMPDNWESYNSLNPTIDDTGGDPDNDMLVNFYEFLNNTDPQDNDTDNDNLLDGEETIIGNDGYITNATNPDTDYDILLDGEESSLGVDGYITNPTNPDSDFDDLSDYWEWLNSTDPWDPDCDDDGLLDGEECTLGVDNYITNATNPDSDFDGISDYWEWRNSTNPWSKDTDGDTFGDYEEINIYNTNPLDSSWYPMPNLIISSFSVSDVYENQAFILNFTILNNGIWAAEGIVVIVRCEGLDLTLYNNMLNPFNLSVDESLTILSDCSEISKKGFYVLSLTIDPDNLINEQYSNKNGTLREDWDNDNSLQIQMRIKAESGLDTSFFDIELLLWILIPIILGIVVTIVGIALKKKREKSSILREKQSKARNDLDEFEQKIRVFIRKQLKDTYKEVWWEKGLPQYIKDAIEPRLKEKLMKDPGLSLDGIDLLNFDHYFPIISEKHNWDNFFSNTFSLVKNIEEPFENLQVFKNKLNQKEASVRDFAKYAMYIYAIEKYFMKEINIFLSYSTLDSDYFKVSEISKRLGRYPEINKLYFWEADSGEDIVDYMERTLQLSKIFILFCSENSIKSQAVEDEWKAAFQLRKKGLMKIIPVYEDDRFIPALLTPLLNVKFERENFEEFVEKLYKEIIRS